MNEGYNPMRWDCERDGCFNVLRRPKIEVFSSAFPRKINFGDVDGLVELNGYFCLLEWKGEGGSVKAGQRYTYESFTKRRGNVVFVVDGNAKTMIITRYCIFWEGKPSAWEKKDLEGLCKKLASWANYVETLPRGDVYVIRKT